MLKNHGGSHGVVPRGHKESDDASHYIKSNKFP
ncbi:hypothetical protein SRIMHP_05820 [Streptomyces rimosus subsp. rimosus]|uniref:Uncharacterized protein n=1 Tax=Streptomyces rimosus subsp. rimosus TaxID=132474 RepID=A0ABY3ZD13_STRRM|nr:hypothetical protein SRIMR7_36555 [Streptomyces rimosus subsp. rimosus]UTH93636.1 hypothetical protein SRIMHP_05820 [Streptomyces rimosus subsp. rimosus]UTJ11731.1 hypothetical protein SRIMDV3_05715 [Streptomyces rimosus subsp. rimosus]